MRDFGAVGNGVADDSRAFLKAIAAMSSLAAGGVIYIPPGHWVRLGGGSESEDERGFNLDFVMLSSPNPRTQARTS